jgi:2-hydroxycyclohexanecarboxyl-CoA dehydrogenase
VGCSNGKVALVTGAGQGVGAGIALALAKEGAAVALVGRRREPLAATAREAESAGARMHVIICDVTDRASVNAAVAETRAALGPVWVLVNNAVSTEDKPLEEVDDESLDLVIKSGI